jgi:hypothetical protein
MSAAVPATPSLCDTPSCSELNNAYELEGLVERTVNEHPAQFRGDIIDTLHGLDIRGTVENLSKDLISIQGYFDDIYTSISLLRDGNSNRPSGFLGIRIPTSMDRIKKSLKSWETIRSVREILFLFTIIGLIFP